MIIIKDDNHKKLENFLLKESSQFLLKWLINFCFKFNNYKLYVLDEKINDKIFVARPSKLNYDYTCFAQQRTVYHSA